MEERMRLLTRSDFDGLGCASVLKHMGIVSEFKFVHPKDVQDGIVTVTDNDILANVPYVRGCGMWFDHHSSEEERKIYGDFKGKCDINAKSAARVIYDYFGGKEKVANPHIDALISAVDKADSADFTSDEILNPSGWALLSFIMDPRTGLGRYKDYRISNYALMEDMIEYTRTMEADEILRMPDVQERVRRYFEQDVLFREMIRNNATIYHNVIVIDLRNQAEIYTGNRFIIYSLYPEQNISVQVIWGLNKQNTVMTCGHSIINRSSNTDVGALMLKYGGGGHRKVGTCQVPNETADVTLKEIVSKMNRDG